MMSAFIMNFISKKFVFGLILTFAVLWVFWGFACFFVLFCFVLRGRRLCKNHRHLEGQTISSLILCPLGDQEVHLYWGSSEKTIWPHKMSMSIPYAACTYM